MLISQHQVHVSVPSKALFIFSIILRSIEQTVKICKKLVFFFFINHSCLIVLIMEITGCHTAWEQDQSLCTINCTCHSTDTDARSDNFKHEQISKNKIRSCLYS